MPTDTVSSQQLSSEDRRQAERRRTPRITIPKGVPITAQVETPNRVLRSAQCVNLSQQGTLLDFGEGKCPPLEKNSKLTVTLTLAGEVANIPGVLRHRTDSRIGLSFNLNALEESQVDEQKLGIILGILERAVDRRTSSSLKDQTIIQDDQPPSPGSSQKDDTNPLSHQTVDPTQDRRGSDRRKSPRIPILQGIPLRAEVVTPDRILRTVRCVDLNSRGALLDFGTGKCPPLALNSQVSVKLHIGGDIADIPSLVRHRTNNRIGVEFPFDQQSQLKDQEKGLGLILRTLERAVARRRSR